MLLPPFRGQTGDRPMLFAEEVVHASAGEVIGWGAIALSLGLAIIAVVKSFVDSYNARQDRRQVAEALRESEKLANAKAIEEMKHKAEVDSRLLELKNKVEACDKKHQDCEEARLREAKRTAEREREHQLAAAERAASIEELQRHLGMPVTKPRVRKPRSSTSLPRIDASDIQDEDEDARHDRDH